MATLNFINKTDAEAKYNRTLKQYRRLEKDLDGGKYRAGERELSDLKRLAAGLNNLLNEIGDVASDKIQNGF
jgi:hypothetical protein